MSAPSLHITLISETFPPEINGLATTLGRLSEGLLQRGHQVELVRPRVSMHKLIRRWRRQRPDVLYIATEGPLGLSALRAARRLGITVVSGFHTNFQEYASEYGLGLLARLLTQYLRWFHRRTHTTLVPSISQHVELQRRGFDNLTLLGRGVDSQLFNPGRRSQTLREQWGLEENDIALLHVGRLGPEKNLGVLQRCLHAARLSYPQRNIRLIVVGDGPQRSALQHQLPDARFCGVQQGEALAEHYASADIFLFPSLTETFGNVVLEALAAGLGVVAYDQAAAAQHIRHGHSGALAMPGDEEAFVDACNWLVEDAEALRRVRLNARQHASRQGWPAIVEQFEGHLYNACRQGQSSTLHQHPAALAVKPESSTPRG